MSSDSDQDMNVERPNDQNTPSNQADSMDIDGGGETSYLNETNEQGGFSDLRLESKSSFSVVQDDLPSFEATIYQATWNGKSDLNELLSRSIKGELKGGSDGDHVDCFPSLHDLGNKAKPPPRTPIDFSKFFNMGLPGGGGGGDGGPPLPPIFFKDCGGLEAQVRFIKTAMMGPLSGGNNNKCKRFSLEPPKSILFFGPPGTGKTRLAQAVGNEVKQLLGRSVHFIYRKGSDVASKWFGESSANLRRVFEEAKQMKPTILFFDELDGLCPNRDKAFMSEGNVTIVTTMLGLMDELPKGEIFVIGATNRLDSIDPALLRPGRFDKHLEFFPPTEKGRMDILQIHTRAWKTAPSKELVKSLSERTTGFSGADISKLCSDSFDQAMKRMIEASPHSLKNTSFKELRVLELDWNAALSKMKPSAAAVFGSVLYTPSNGVGPHVDRLAKSNIEAIRAVIRPMLPTSSTQAGIKSVYLLSKPAVLSLDMDDMIMSSLFRSEEIAKFPIYRLSSEVLSSVRWSEWPRKINNAFSQAVGSNQPAILYMPQVDQLWNSIVNMKLETSVNLPQLIENLRGKKVLLISTGSSQPWQFPSDCPFKKVFNAVHQLQYPSQEERIGLFDGLLATIQVNHDTWTEENVASLDHIVGAAVIGTDGRDIGSVVCLYDGMKRGLALQKTGGGDDVTNMLMNIIRKCRL